MALRLFSNVVNIPKRHAECGFQNYKTDPDNEKQLAVCKKWSDKESITLTGYIGTGKTHLAIALLRNFPMIPLNDIEAEKQKSKFQNDLIYLQSNLHLDGSSEKIEYYQKLLAEEVWKYRRANCLFVPIVEMFVEINTAANADEGKQAVLRKYSTSNTYDCICFDDLGAEKLTDAKRENLYYIIDSRYREMLPTIITSNFTIKEINEVEPRIASRLAEMGIILQFNGKDFRKNNF